MAKNKKLRLPDDSIATQSNHLIEASYKMSVPAKRVMLLLLSKIHPGQRDVTGKIRIEAADYAMRSDVSLTAAYRDLKKGADELQNVIITTRDHTNRTTEKRNVVVYQRYHDDEGWLEAAFSIWLTPYIHNLIKVGYTTIEVNDALKFSSFHTIRLFELLMQFRRTGARFITIDMLKKILQLEKNQYPRFTDFRRFVIEKAIKEIEKKTTWKVDWEPIKTGRTITSLSLIFEKQSQEDMFK